MIVWDSNLNSGSDYHDLDRCLLLGQVQDSVPFYYRPGHGLPHWLLLDSIRPRQQSEILRCV